MDSFRTVTVLEHEVVPVVDVGPDADGIGSFLVGDTWLTASDIFASGAKPSWMTPKPPSQIAARVIRLTPSMRLRSCSRSVAIVVSMSASC